MQTSRPRITWKVYGKQVAIFQEIFDQMQKDLDCGVLF